MTFFNPDKMEVFLVEIFDKIFNKKRRMKNAINILLVVIVLIHIYLKGFDMNYNDPGGDSAIIIDSSKNIKDGNGYVNDFIYLYHGTDGSEYEEIVKPAFIYPPLVPILLSFFLYFSESIFVLVLFQIFVFAITLNIYFNTFSKKIGEKLAFFSTLLILFNPVIITEVVSVPRTHIVSLFFVVVFISLEFKSRKNRLHYYLLGVVAGLAYLTRDVNIAIILGLILYLSYQGKFDKLKQSLTSFSLIVIPWFIRNYYYFGDLIPRTSTTGSLYPPAGLSDNSVFSHLNTKIFIQNFEGILNLFASTDFYFLYFPFVFMALIRYYRKEEFSLCFLISSLYFLAIILIPFLVEGHKVYLDEYFIPVFCLTIPFALKIFKDLLDETNIFDSKNFIFAIIFVTTLTANIVSGIAESYNQDDTSFTQDPLSDYEWVNENIDSDSNFILVERHVARFHYYTGNFAVKFPFNLDNNTFVDFVKTYQIEYVFIQKSENAILRYPNFIFLFEGDSNIALNLENENIEFKLINSQKSSYNGENIFIYEIVF